MKKQIVAALATVSLAMTIAGGIAASKGFAAEKPTKEQAVLLNGEWTISEGDKPVYGSKYSVPTATVKIDGNDVSASAYVVTPDGKNVSGGEITLSKAGRYTIVYSVYEGGNLYKTEKTFEVDAPFISAGEKSSFEYGTYTDYGSKANNTGFLLKIAEREEVTFNKLINFDKLNKNDKLLDLFILPKTQGSADFDRLIMTFTDSVDSEITMTVVLDRVSQTKWPGSDSLSYVKAAGNGQDITGVESFGTSVEKIHVNNEWGAGVPVSFTAMNDQSGATIVPADMSFGISFDGEENILKARGVTVTDFDDAKYYKTLWKGFPSGKAKLSISASGLNSETANVVVTEIFGLDFSETTIKDETAPIITVLTDYETLPNGEAGRVYPIPSATAVDDYSGNCDVETKVVYAYGTDKALTVKTTEGKIIPEYAGEYTIIYEAKDGYGNASEKIYTFSVSEQIPDIELVVPKYGEYALGDTLVILSATTVGGSGRIELETKVTRDGDEVEVENGKVKLGSAGEWKVIYIATDYLGNHAENVVELNVKTSETPVFDGMPNLPQIMIEGSGYTIPEFYAEDYSSGSCVYKLCDVTVIDSYGKKVMTSGDEYVARANENGDCVTFIYECDGEKCGEEISVPVIIPKTTKKGKNVLDVTKYFYGTGFSVSASSTDVTIEAKEDGDFEWIFGNAILAEIFSVDIHTIPDKSNFGGLKFTLTDRDDKDNSVSATLEYKKGKTYLKVNDSSIEISGGFGSFTATTIKLAYENKTFSVGNTEIAVKTRDDGSEFKGFGSDKAYLKVTAVGAKKGAAYDVRSINLHRFNSGTADYTEPSVYVSGKYGGAYNLGGTYVIPAAFAGDVLAPQTKITLNVYAPDGKIIRDVKGRKLENVDPSEEYEIPLNQYGQYTIEYTASEVDWWNRTKPFQYMVSVYDGDKPTITFAETPKRAAKVGDVYVLPKFDVKDNVTASDKILVGAYVVNSEGKVIKLDGNAFKFDASGKYTFRIIAIDEQGNAAIKEITVSVSE